MNNHNFTRCILVASAMLLGPVTARADQNETNNLNHFSFSARVGFNVTARFKNLGNLTLIPSARTTPNGDPYNYDNGYLLTDISGNAGGQSWYWGYDGPGQVVGNTILLSRSTPQANTASPLGNGSSDPSLGWELNYNRQLGENGKWRYGIEAAVNYTKVCFNDHSTFSGNASQVTDAYPFTPGTTPPATPPAYQGTFIGPGFLIGSTPISSTTTTVAGGAVIVGQRQFNSDIWGFRLGPYIEYPLTERLDVSLSAGLAVGLLQSSASWNEVISMAGAPAATSSGSGNNTALVWGGYVRANLSWQLSEHWSAEGGVQYQNLGTFQHDMGTRAIELDLSKSIFVTVGVGYKF